MEVDWKTALRIEHKVAEIIAAQERAGWPFRLDLAKQYITDLDAMAEEIEPEIMDMLGYYYIKKNPVGKPFKKNGELNARAAGISENVGGAFTPIEYHQIELTQHAKVGFRLMQLGWEPTKFTETGQPQLKVDGEPCPNLLKMPNSVGLKLAKYSKVTHRRNQIQGWIDACREDGRVPALANPNGTNTGRMTHKIVANVPKASDSVFFGKEMRSLFVHRGGEYKLVGFDAEGLELRIAAHYINSKEFTNALIYGDKTQGTDPHTRVLHACRAYEVESRDDAKSCVYSTVYGASGSKVAATVNVSQGNGDKIKSAVESVFPGISTLKPKVQAACTRGYLVGLDGRKVFMRYDKNGKMMKHKALNYLFQSGGGIAMKVVLCFLAGRIEKKGADVTFVGNIHDEVQAEVHEDWIPWYREAVDKAFEDTTKFLSLRCPLAGETKVGDSWAETH